MNRKDIIELNKKVCPSVFVTSLFGRLKNDLKENAELTEDEWVLVEYMHRNLLVNFTGNYCGCDECLSVYHQLKAEMPSYAFIVNGHGDTVAEGKEAKEYDGKTQ